MHAEDGSANEMGRRKSAFHGATDVRGSEASRGGRTPRQSELEELPEEEVAEAGNSGIGSSKLETDSAATLGTIGLVGVETLT